MSETKSEVYLNKLKDLWFLYDDVKSAIILAEQWHPKRHIYIAPINELRGALDHIFKSINLADDEKKCDYQLQEVREHMGRAGFDALEMLVRDVLDNIFETLEPFSKEALKEVIHDYYPVFRPKITEIQTNIAQYRKEGKTEPDKSFTKYFVEIKKLKEINTEIEKKVPALQEFMKSEKRNERKQNRKAKKDLFFAFLLVLFGAIITWLLGLWIS